MGKLKKFILISILICALVRESLAQSSRSNRKKANENNLSRKIGSDHRINQDPNNGLSLQNVKQRRPGSQRRRTKSGQQRQDHG